MLNNLKIRSMAVYSTLIDGETSSNNFLSPFIRLVGMIIYEEPSVPYNEQILREKVFEVYGVDIPHMPMRNILRHWTNKNLLCKRNAHGYFIVNNKDVFKADYERILIEKNNFEHDYDDLIEDCFKYIIDEFDPNLSKKAIEDSFQLFISTEVDNLNLSIIQPKYEKQCNSDKISYFIGSYIYHIKEYDDNKVKIIQNILIGDILAESVKVSLPKCDTLHGLVIVFDTPILFYLLNICLLPLHDVYVDLVKNTQKLGGETVVFKRSIDEMRCILSSAEYWLYDPHYNPYKASDAAEYYCRNHKNKSDIEIDIISLEEKLLKYGLKILDNTLDENYNQNEQEICDEIRKIYSENGSCNLDSLSKTINTDATSINNIFWLREGSKESIFNKSKAILVTNNIGLFFAAKNFTQKLYPEQNVFPPCINDVFLGTIIWLNDTIKLREVSFKKLIAHAYISFQPTESFWKAFVKKLEQLKENGDISDKNCILLRTQPIVREVLMKTTYGEEKNIQIDTIDVLLKEAKQDIISEQKQKSQQENFALKEEVGKQRKILQHLRENNIIRKKCNLRITLLYTCSILIILAFYTLIIYFIYLFYKFNILPLIVCLFGFIGIPVLDYFCKSKFSKKVSFIELCFMMTKKYKNKIIKKQILKVIKK